MTEIRLCWRAGILHGQDDQVQNGGNWMEATINARRDLKIILEAALEIYGPATHWIEVRHSEE